MGLLQSAAGEADAPAGKTPPPPGRDNMEQIQALAVRKPVVAAINGAAAGIGLVTALMADVRFAAEGIKMTTAFSRRGEYSRTAYSSGVTGNRRKARKKSTIGVDTATADGSSARHSVHSLSSNRINCRPLSVYLSPLYLRFTASVDVLV